MSAIARRSVLAGLASLMTPAKADMLLLDAGSSVRGTSWKPNTTDIPSLKAWYDTTDASKITLDASSLVSEFRPSVGDPADFALSQVNELERPRVGLYGSKSVLSFTDINRKLQKPPVLLPDRNISIAMVIAWRTVDDNSLSSIAIINSAEVPDQVTNLMMDIPGLFAYKFGTPGSDEGSTYRTAALGDWVISTTRDRASWVNGGDPQQMTTGLLTENPRAVMLLGGFVGNAGHWIVCTGETTDADLRKLEGFVAWDLGIQSVLVAGHPYKDQAP